MENMENSINSMSRSSPAPSYEGVADENPEESSWTIYFEDFSNNNNIDGNSWFSSDSNYQTSSLVSDAACSAAGRYVLGSSLDHHKNFNNNRLSFKKRKIKGSAGNWVDDDLEDTASSPPKFCNLMNHFDKNMKQKDAMNTSQEIKGSASGQIDESNGELGFNGTENDGTELKKKGLCLVPLSMVVQYLG